MTIALALIVSLAGCGADDLEPDPGQPSATPPDGTDRVQVADIGFDGRFFVTAVVVAGEDIGLVSTPALEIETQFGGLTVEPGCNTYFGSFTLDGATSEGAGSASFTITGGSNNRCAELEDQEQAVLQALGSATGWVASDTGFRFEGATSSISISR